MSLAIRLGAALLLNTPIQSDFALQYQAAQQFAQGDFSFQETEYFQRWGYQTGLVIWQGALLKLWDNPLLLRLVNCLLSAGTNVLVYLIARDCFEERAARLAGLSYAFFLFPATLVAVLCNNIPSGFFLYLCLYLVMGKPFARWNPLAVYALAGASLALANALRPDAPLVLVPLLAYFVFQMASRASLRNFLQYAKGCAALLLVFFALSAGMSWLVKAAGVNQAGLGNHDPLWGLVVGTNAQTGGVYSEENFWEIEAWQAQGLTRSQAQQAVIRDHLSAGPFQLVGLAANKMKVLWWERALNWALGDLAQSSPDLFALLEDLDGAMFAWAFFLALAGAVALFRNPKADFKTYLLPFVFFAASCVYLLLEVQPRYAYAGQIALFILMAGGVQALGRCWKRLRPAIPLPSGK